MVLTSHIPKKHETNCSNPLRVVNATQAMPEDEELRVVLFGWDPPHLQVAQSSLFVLNAGKPAFNSCTAVLDWDCRWRGD